MNAKLFRLGLLATAVLLASASQANATASVSAYTFTDLGTLGGANSGANAINNAGQVAGWAQPTGTNLRQATLWNGTTATHLTLPFFSEFSEATAINNVGQVAGTEYSGTPSHPSYSGVLWSGTTTTALLPADLLGLSEAHGINDAGQVVGVTSALIPVGLPMLWNGATGRFATGTVLGTLGGDYGVANAINNAGQVAGSAALLSNQGSGAAVWNGTTATALGTLGGIFSGANAINDVGQAVGYSSLPGDADTTHATLWNGTTPTDLGTLGGTDSRANAINEAGQIVGDSLLAGDAAFHATLWNGTTLTDLNSFLDASTSADWVLRSATGINDNGWIVGYAVNATLGVTHAFLLTPVPEPETYAMLLAGLGLIGFVCRRRKAA